MTDAERLDAIRERLAKRTPGEWSIYRGEESAIGVGSMATRQIVCRTAPPFTTLTPADIDANTDFIAHAPDDLAWLLARLDALRESSARAAPGAPTSPVAGAPEGTHEEGQEAYGARDQGALAASARCRPVDGAGEVFYLLCGAHRRPIDDCLAALRGLTPDVERVVRILNEIAEAASNRAYPGRMAQIRAAAYDALAALRGAPAASGEERHLPDCSLGKHGHPREGECDCTPPAAPGPGR